MDVSRGETWALACRGFEEEEVAGGWVESLRGVASCGREEDDEVSVFAVGILRVRCIRRLGVWK